MRSIRAAAVPALVYLLVVGYFAARSIEPPPALPASAPPEKFSAGRAHLHVARAFTEPHPAGTTAHRRVFEYLVGVLRAMDVEYDVQQTTAVRVLPGTQPAPGTNVANVRNVVARLRGARPGKALLLVAHYDSVVWGPGAADDGSGCAALLETLRALKAGPRLDNDVLFLFADAEESGLMGAHAFAGEHPWMRDVALVFNFDVRGIAGPSLMFETGPHSLGLIPHLARACSRPLANSLMGSIYYRMGLNSDFTPFRRLGLRGFNFAFIRGIAYYHTANDRPENLDLRSLQHQGDNALELARYFGNLPIERLPTGDAVYFNPAGYRLIYYPAAWVGPLAIFTVAWLAVLIVMGTRRGRVRKAGILRGALGVLACILAAGGAILAVTLLAWAWRRYYMVYDDPLYLATAVAATVLVFDGVLRKVLRSVAWREAWLGAVCVWAAMLVASAVALPGASFGFQWPLTFALLALSAELATPLSPAGAVLRVAVHAVSAAAVLLFAVPATLILHDGITAVLAPVTALWMALVLGLLIPWLALERAALPRLLPAISAVAAVTAIGAIIARSLAGPTTERPEVVSLSYALNADDGRAFWLSRAVKPNRFEQRFFPAAERGAISEFRPRDRAWYLKEPAPRADMEPMQCQVVSQTVSGPVRRLVLRLRSPGAAQRVEFHLDPAVPVLASRINGKAYASGRPWWFEYHGFGHSEAELEIEVPASAKPRLTTIEYLPGLPDLPGSGAVRLPPGWILEPNTTGWGRGLRSGWTLVRRTFDLGR